MRHGSIFHQAFSARIHAHRALCAAADTRTNNADDLRAAANELDDISGRCDYRPAAASYAAIAELARCLAMLVEWRAAVLGAEKDTDRFLHSAKARYELFTEENKTTQVVPELIEKSRRIKEISHFKEVDELCAAVSMIPLPIPVFKAFDRHEALSAMGLDAKDDQTTQHTADLSVAFLHFTINGIPAAETHFLRPRETHDLEIEVRVSRWPETAETLCLSPISIEPKGTYDFPRFQFTRPQTPLPFILTQRGRAILNVAQNIHARPFEFKYTAEFLPSASEQPIAIVGQRSLRIEAIDIQKEPITGYQHMDAKLLTLRDRLRSNRLLSHEDLDATLLLLKTLCSLSCRALHDGLFPGIRGEDVFQDDVRNELRRTPEIASELEEHPCAAGGITDLSFRGIRIELKAEHRKLVTLDDCEQFIQQTLSYVVATGKRVGLLCVLDCSPKSAFPLPADESIDISLQPTKESSIAIIKMIIQGNLPKPSTFSKKNIRK